MRREADFRATFDRKQLAQPRPSQQITNIAPQPATMSAESSKRSVSRTVRRWVAISLVCFAAIWSGVVAWWKMTEHIASMVDVLLYMIVLPLGVLAVVALLGRVTFPKGGRAHPPRADMDATPAGIPPEAIAAGDARLPDLPILAAWAITRIGSAGSEFVDELAQRRQRPVPDPLLVDGDGFPPLTGRVPDVDTDRVCATLLRLYPQRVADEADIERSSDSVLRALALLESVLQQAAEEWPLVSDDALASASASRPLATLRGSAGLPSDSDSPLELHVKLLLSEALTPFEKHVAQAYAEQRLAALGVLTSRQPVDIVPTANDATALKLIDTFRLDAYRAERQRIPQALLVLACDSALCQTTIDAWEAHGRLFAAHRPNGLMPGEGAFAILCANEMALQASVARPLCYLAHTAHAQRSNNIGREKAHECLTGVIRDALSASGTAGDEIGTVVCDADHRTGVTLETIEAMLSEMPGMDAIESRLAVNEFCGHLGAASVPGVLAAAALRAHAAGHPVLAFNASHASERAAAVMLPADDDQDRAQLRSIESA